MFDIDLEDTLGIKIRHHYSHSVNGDVSDRMIRAVEKLAAQLQKQMH